MMRWLIPLCCSIACRDQTIDSEPTDSSDTHPIHEDSGDSIDSADSGDTTIDGTGEPFVALVSDGGNERFLVIDLNSGDIIWSYDMRIEYPEECLPDDGIECGAYGASHELEPFSGDDLFTLTWHRMDLAQPTGIGGRQSRVDRIRLAPEGQQIDWSLQHLDFQTHFSETGLCPSTTPCSAPIDAGQTAWSDCSMVMVHDVEIIEETETMVRMWLADTGNSRALLVNLPKNETCGTVEEVIDGQTTAADDWDHFTWVNDVDLVQVDGMDHVLLTTKGSDSFVQGAHGRGKITLWEPTKEQWQLVWEHPVRDDKAASFLNAPHNADWITDSDGQHYVVYGHSNGAGAHFEDEQWTPEEDHRGSMGVLRVGADGPDYLADFTLEIGELGFTRDVDWLPDGSWLVTDSGCKGELGCPKEPAIRHVEFDLQTLQSSGLDGRFDGTGIHQRYIRANELDTHWESPRQCDMAATYEADSIAILGTGLTARMNAPEASCP